MVPSRRAVTLLAATFRSSKRSGTPAPKPTPPRSRIGSPTRFASVALVTGATRASRSARTCQVPGAMVALIRAAPLALPISSNATCWARTSPAIPNSPRPRSPCKATSALVVGKRSARFSAVRRAPLRRAVPRSVPLTRRGSSRSLPVATRPSRASSGKVQRAPSYRAIPCWRRSVIRVPPLVTSPISSV